MSSDEVDTKNEESEVKDTASSVEEEEEKQETKEEKTNNKAASKKKAADPPKIKQPAKKRVKTAPEDDKKEDSDKEDEESDEENAKVPLLDQPLEVTGRRRRSEVQRFKPAEEESKDKELKIPQGKGLALGDISGIEENLQKTKPEDLKALHRICFGKVGKANEVKKNLKKFNGFECEKESKEYDAKVKKMIGQKFTKPQLTVACRVLKLEKSGSKDDLLFRVLEFLVCPKDLGDAVPEKGTKAAKKPKKAPAAKKSKKRGRKNAKDSEDEDEGEESIEEDSEEEKHEEKNGKESNNKDNSTEESDLEKDDKKSDKEDEEETKKDKNESEDKKAPPKKRAAAKKAAEKNSESEEVKEDKKSEGDKSDDEPAEKKPKPSPPSDDEIKTYIKSLLDGADLEQITMKKVCQDVYAHYPSVDLTHKKDFIKTTVKNIISS